MVTLVLDSLLKNMSIVSVKINTVKMVDLVLVINFFFMSAVDLSAFIWCTPIPPVSCQSVILPAPSHSMLCQTAHMPAASSSA